MNTGIQDAYNIGWKLGLILRGADAKLLETSVLQLTTKLLDRFQSPERALPSDNERLQLGLNYRYSSLSKQATSLQLPLQAGDRAPDAPLQSGEGERLRLFDLFRGGRVRRIYRG
jgi:hypothetical protein